MDFYCCLQFIFDADLYLVNIKSRGIKDDIPTHYRCVGKHIPCKVFTFE